MRRSLILLVALLAAPVYAGDGDPCREPGDPEHSHPNETTRHRIVWRCRMLCDAQPGNGACAHINLETLPLPVHVIAFEARDVQGCPANWQADIRGVHDVDADPPETPFTYLTLEQGRRKGKLRWDQPGNPGPPARLRVIRRNCAAGDMTIFLHLGRLRLR